MRLLAALARRPAANGTLRRLLSTAPSAATGVSPRALAAGMASAATIGIGIGMMLPGVKERERSAKGDQLRDSARRSTVSVADIADDLPRPALIQDAVREEIEDLYEFISCLASGGSATVWRAIERSTGRAVAIKVIDKKLLPSSLLNLEVSSMQRCAGHPHIVQLLAAYELAGDHANPNGEWHLVMELAEGGELFERLLQHGAYTEKIASKLLLQAARAIYHLHSCGSEWPPPAKTSHPTRPPHLLHMHAYGSQAACGAPTLVNLGHRRRPKSLCFAD